MGGNYLWKKRKSALEVVFDVFCRVVTHLVDGVVDELLDVDLSVVCVGGEQYSNEKVETTVLLKS
jgi:hypothetical protein